MFGVLMKLLACWTNGAWSKKELAGGNYAAGARQKPKLERQGESILKILLSSGALLPRLRVG